MSEQPPQLLRSAVERYRAGDLATASKLFEQVVQRDPANQQAWMGLAVCTENIPRKQHYLKRVVALGADTKIGKQAHDKLMQLAAPAAPAPAAPAAAVPAAPDTAQMLARILEEVQALRAEVAHLRNGVHALPAPEPSPEPAPEPSPEPAAPAENNPQRIKDLLAERGVTIESIREPDSADAVFDQLAMQLGNNYQQLAFFYTNFRRYLNIDPAWRGDFNLKLLSRSEQEISAITGFCSDLLKYAFVQSYRYEHETQTIYLSLKTTGDIPRFFTGYWFERYVFRQVCDALDAGGMDYAALANVKIQLAGGEHFELDMLVLVDDVLLWIECKTGGYKEYIPKYIGLRQTLNIAETHMLLVVLGLELEKAATLSVTHSLTFVGHEQLTEQLALALGISDADEDEVPSPTSDKSATPDKPPDLSKFLGNYQLSPHPELRPVVLAAIIKYVRAATKPLLLKNVKEKLPQQLPQVSKKDLHPILNALMRGECLLDEQGEVVRSFTQPFVRLVSNDAPQLEIRCQRAYIQAILRKYPAFFSQRQHYLDFEKVVGTLPTPDLVELVRTLPIS